MAASVFLTYSLPANANVSVATVTTSGAITATGTVTAGAVSTAGDVGAATVTLANGGALRTDTTNGHTAVIQAYDADDATYRTFATLTNGNTPTFATLPPSGGTIAVSATTYAVGATAGVDYNANVAHLTTSKGIVTGAS